MTQTLDLLDWRARLAGDRRVVAFTEADRYGVLFAVAVCKNRLAARGLLEWLQAGGCPGAALRSHDTVWLGATPSYREEDGPAPLDFTGLEDVVG